MSRAALFVHGFMGSTAQFGDLTGITESAGYDTTLLTLPGHGADAEVFIRSGAEDWQKAVGEALNGLADEYDEILLVGHSMGGILLINAASKSPAKVRGILALALPLRIRLTWRSTLMRAKLLSPPRANEDEYTAAARAMCGVSGLKLSNTPRLIPNSIALLTIARRARGGVPLSVPLTAVISDNDEVVSPRSAEIAARLYPDVKTVRLMRAGHFQYDDEESEIVREALTNML